MKTGIHVAFTEDRTAWRIVDGKLVSDAEWAERVKRDKEPFVKLEVPGKEAKTDGRVFS